MEKLILQKIIYPSYEMDEQQLYYRYTGTGVVLSNNVLLIGEHTTVDFGTYFNSLGVEKWLEYTNVEDYLLNIEIKGKGVIQVYHAYLNGGTTCIEEIKQIDFSSADYSSLVIDLPSFDEGLIGFRIVTEDEPVSIKDAYYFTENVETTDVSLALAFTTYKRETYITENVRRILSLEDDRIHIFIVDNAGTLTLDANPNLTVFTNLNSGGAGGFARNMMEIIATDSPFTHVILMDDDVTIDPRVYHRLIRFLSVISPKYNNAFIGGAMFRRDYKYFHVESGAKWRGTLVWPFGHGLDMRRLDSVLLTNSIHKEDYNAWWFCCIPMKYIREDNLPLPLFFQWDDIDYGLRNAAPLILLNGICLWHDAFETKRSAMYTYYSNRNPLIVNGCHEGGYNKRQVLKTLKKKMRAEIGLYRYEHAKALIKAMEDYQRGPEWLCNINPDEYNKEILSMNKPISYVADQVDYDWYLVGCQIDDCDLLHKLVRILTLNGYLLKANRKITLPLFAEKPVAGYRATRILFYEINTGTGYWAEKSMKEALCCLVQFYKQYFRLKIRYGSIVRSYREKYTYLTSKEMWEKYLGLK